MRAIVIAAFLLVGCEKSKTSDINTASGTGTGTSSTPGAGKGGVADLDSKDILARDPQTGEVLVKHVLIAWKDLAGAYQGHIDPRAAARTNADAAKLAADVAAQLRASPDRIDALIKQYSEDPGSLGGDPYTVSADSQFVPEFKKMALRLKPKEVGDRKSVV